MSPSQQSSRFYVFFSHILSPTNKNSGFPNGRHVR